MMLWLLRLADRARQRARARSWDPAQAAGRRGEDIAHRYLENRGFLVVARNYRPRSGHGEIDLVAWEQNTLVFVEVKTRASEEYGAPERNLDAAKRQALFRAARDYARHAEVAWEHVRFDTVAILLEKPPRIRHRRGAFSL